jgi:hypothetical protein
MRLRSLRLQIKYISFSPNSMAWYLTSCSLLGTKTNLFSPISFPSSLISIPTQTFFALFLQYLIQYYSVPDCFSYSNWVCPAGAANLAWNPFPVSIQGPFPCFLFGCC